MFVSARYAPKHPIGFNGITTEGIKIKLSDIKLGMVLLLVLVSDIYTKYIVQSRMLLHQTHSLIPDFLDITYVENPGAAFGLMANAHASWRNIFLGVVSSVAIIMLIVLYRHHARENEKIKFALGLILMGAIGNILDRIRFGVVIDFIDVHVFQYHWPAFNVADSAICVGVGVLLWQFWQEGFPD